MYNIITIHYISDGSCGTHACQLFDGINAGKIQGAIGGMKGDNIIECRMELGG